MHEALKVIEAISKSVDSLFLYIKENKIRQSETQVVRDKRRLKQATNIAQKIFSITDGYSKNFSKDDRIYYEKLRKKFDDKD